MVRENYSYRKGGREKISNSSKQNSLICILYFTNRKVNDRGMYVIQKQRLEIWRESLKSVSNVTGKVCYENVKAAMVKMLEYWKKLEY